MYESVSSRSSVLSALPACLRMFRLLLDVEGHFIGGAGQSAPPTYHSLSSCHAGCWSQRSLLQSLFVATICTWWGKARWSLCALEGWLCRRAPWVAMITCEAAAAQGVCDLRSVNEQVFEV